MSRLAALPLIAASAAGLVLIARYRPGLPELPDSLSSPLTTTQVQQLVLVATWLLSGLLLGWVLVWSLVALVASGSPAQPPRARAYAPTPRRRVIGPIGRSAQPAFAPPFLLVPRGTSPDIPDDTIPTGGPPSEPVARDAVPGASIALLGPIEITTAEPRARGLRSKTQELLVYLALHPKGATAEELAAAVLPGVDDERAKRRIWRAISEVRSEVGAVLQRSGDRYLLNRSAVAIDVDEFGFLIAQAKAEGGPTRERLLGRALALVRGRPLVSADYAWVAGDMRHLCAKVVEALHELGELRLALEDPTGALAAAERALEFDTDNESAHRLAMRAESALGLREAVVKRYERLSRRLDRRFGLEPEQQTRLLHRRLLSQDGGAPVARPVPQSTVRAMR